MSEENRRLYIEKLKLRTDYTVRILELQHRIFTQEDELEHLRLKSHIYSFLACFFAIALAATLLLRVG